MLRTAVLGTLSALLAFALSSASGCGTDAVGVDDCRKIENARCEAGQACGVITDAASCQRFYRDHCLHGLALEEAPGAPTIAGCVKAIQAAGKCGPKAELAECAAVHPVEDGIIEAPCDVVLHPEWVKECSFLTTVSGGGEGGSGGAGGSGGGGGSGGSD